MQRQLRWLSWILCYRRVVGQEWDEYRGLGSQLLGTEVLGQGGLHHVLTLRDSKPRQRTQRGLEDRARE